MLQVRVFANQMRQQDLHQADLTAIRIASVNPILDPWIYILLRRSLFKRILRSSRRARVPHHKRSSSLPSTQALFYPGLEPATGGGVGGGGSHVLTQLLSNANVITQLPAYIPYDPEAQQQQQQQPVLPDWTRFPAQSGNPGCSVPRGDAL